MSVLLLVRHGQASFGSADYDRLSPLGESQARVLGESLARRGLRPDLVVRGSLRRHRQTTDACLAGAQWSVDVAEDAGWDEFDHRRTEQEAMRAEQAQQSGPQGVGVGVGVGVEERLQESLEDQVRRFEDSVSRWSSGDHDADYHESFPAFQARVEQALRRTLERLGPRETGVVFTSGGPVSWVTATLTGGGVTSWRRLADVVVNSSVTKVVAGSRGATLISFNDHAHLEHDTALITYR